MLLDDGPSRIYVRGNSTIAQDVWTFVAFTYNGSKHRNGVQMYVNANKETKTNLGNDTIAGSIDAGVPLAIGSRNGNSASNPFDGDIDDVYIFDVELTETQMTNLYWQTKVDLGH
jgi:hypothetical protein